MLRGDRAMISFIKSNLNILALIFILFFTVDVFLLSIKFKNYIESLPNLKISYDILKSYCFGFYYYGEYKLAIVNLTLENISTNPIDITKINLIDGSKWYLATFPKIKDDYNENGIVLINEDETKFIDINILSENIIKNTIVSPHGTLNGYAVFENVEPITNPKNYKIIIETPRKVFEKEIIINPLSNEFHPINPLEEDSSSSENN
jgi:hypothetical protein